MVLASDVSDVDPRGLRPGSGAHGRALRRGVPPGPPRPVGQGDCLTHAQHAGRAYSLTLGHPKLIEPMGHGGAPDQDLDVQDEFRWLLAAMNAPAGRA